MIRPDTIFDMWANAVTTSQILMEANAVITMRVMGMAGLWSVTPAENTRMVSEKIQAASRAVAAANKVALSGGSPDEIAAAALKPIRVKTRANARRLLRRGFRKG